MHVSIITPTFNKLECLRQTLAALERQQFPPSDFEVIVVDDHSTDGTHAFLETGGFAITVRPVFHDRNRGRAVARNSGLLQAQGRIILFLDDDMETPPDFISQHLALHCSGDKTVVIGNSLTSPRLQQNAFTRYLDHTGVHRLKPGQDIQFKYFSTNNASVTRTLFDSVGYFDPLFREYGGEDVELGYRLKTIGQAVFRYAPQAVAYHLHLKDLAATCRQLEHYGTTSLYHIYRRYPALKQAIHLSYLDPLDIRRLRFPNIGQKLLYWVLYNPPIRQIIWLVSGLPLGKLAHPVYDYLLSYSYLKGLTKRIRQEKE